MTNISLNTLGWRMITWHRSGGCIDSWHLTLDEAYKKALYWENMNTDTNMDTSTVKIEFIRCKYKDRMK